MTRRILTLSLLLGLALALWACESTPTPDTEGKRLDLQNNADAAIAQFKVKDPSMKEKFFDTAVGWAVFPSVGKGAVGVGGAYGRGVLYEKGMKVGYCDLSQASVGLQVGGQSYRELVFFQNKEALDLFKSGNARFTAQASAVAVTSGAAGRTNYDEGMAVFTMTIEGLMLEASIGGQKFTYEPFK
jgi:lipid-binding SYLF domain-containing protein